jgi:hypothetical protein
MNQIWKFLTSLRVTVVLLCCAIVLVFVGTVAQADEGLYQVQDRYFRHAFVVGTTLWGLHLPWFVWPGGYTIGIGLLVNLVAAHIKRFKWSMSKVGIHLTHLGVVILLVGQLATDLLQVETRMSFKEGQSSNFLEHHRDYELSVAKDVADGKEEIVAIPEALLDTKHELSTPQLPFTIRLKEYHPNAEVRQRAPMVDKGEPPATQGLGPKVTMTPFPEAKDMDTKNLPAAILEIFDKGKSLGTWIVSPFLNAQNIDVDGQTYRVQLRDERAYLPYGITLLKATHKVYPGSDTPKDFRSRVKITNPQTHEDREVEISMNNPLRYNGLAFFQYQMNKDELDRSPGTSTLMVVRNPSWLAPYIGCIVVALGLIWQFLHHLVGFISKRLTA